MPPLWSLLPVAFIRFPWRLAWVRCEDENQNVFRIRSHDLINHILKEYQEFIAQAFTLMIISYILFPINIWEVKVTINNNVGHGFVMFVMYL